MATSKKTGRPTKYKEEFNREAYELCLLGFTDVELAQYFEVEERTLNNWKQEHPAFFQSLKDGKEIADRKVAESLYKRATGTTVKTVIQAKKGGKVVGTREIIAEVAPDTKAAQYWLNNRNPKLWRHRQDVEHSGNISIKLDGDIQDWAE